MEPVSYRITIEPTCDDLQIRDGVTNAYVQEGVLCIAYEDGSSEFYNMNSIYRWTSRPMDDGTGSD